MYALMAIPLHSFLQPFLIITAIPFGFVGATEIEVEIGEVVVVLGLAWREPNRVLVVAHRFARSAQLGEQQCVAAERVVIGRLA